MDKLQMESVDNVQMNIEKIQKLFPNAVTEVKRNGRVTLAVDFDVLKQELSSELIDDKEERYQMTWPDKKKSILLANTPVNKTLRPCKEESVDFDNTQNLYIEGDNLDVLKLLQETYLGKIKMIYIDPPYNTGNDFVYTDDFAMDSAGYADKSGQYDEQGDRLVQNTESNGRFHTDWLNMIYPRLKVAKDLLSDDGVIFISIDDNEQDNLKKICDEIFGDSNFIACFVIDKTAQGANQSSSFKQQHEYCLLYKKNGGENINYSISKPTDLKKYKYTDKKGRYAITNAFDSINSPLSQNKNRGYTVYYNESTGEARVKNEYNSSTQQFGLYDQELIAHGFTPIRPSIRNGVQYPWNWEYSRFLREYKDELVFQRNKNGQLSIYHKNRDSGEVKDTTIQQFDTRKSGNQVLTDIFNNKVFDYPKSINMMKWVLKKYMSDDYTILDFFSGSATTAHAVMQLNAEDGGNRKFIMVQLPEKCDEKSEAYKAGYKTICDIGKERIRRAGTLIKKYIEEVGYQSKRIGMGMFTPPDNLDEINKKMAQDLDVGFRVLKLDSSNMKDVYYKPSDYSQNLLDSFENNIKEDRTPLDLLFQVMLDLGKPLSAKIEEKEIAGKQVFIVDDNDLIACFDKDVTEETVTAIAKLKPLYAVLRDSGLSSDSVGANFDQIFATYSPNTTRKVL